MSPSHQISHIAVVVACIVLLVADGTTSFVVRERQVISSSILDRVQSRYKHCEAVPTLWCSPLTLTVSIRTHLEVVRQTPSIAADEYPLKFDHRHRSRHSREGQHPSQDPRHSEGHSLNKTKFQQCEYQNLHKQSDSEDISDPKA